MTGSVEIFYSYAHEDEFLRDELEKHLSILQRQHLIASWHDRKISAGKEWSYEIDTHFNHASIILLLVSSDFLNSDYCYSREMARALEKHKTGQVRVIPVILRPTAWEETPLGALQALPKDGKPITTWLNRDEAFLSVTQGIRTAVSSLTAVAASSHHASSPQNDQVTLNQQLPSSSLLRTVADRQEHTFRVKHLYLLASSLTFILILALVLERFSFSQSTPPSHISVTSTSVTSNTETDTYSPTNTTLQINDNFRGGIIWSDNQKDREIGKCVPKEDGYPCFGRTTTLFSTLLCPDV